MVELLIVFAIMTVMSSVIMFNYSSFSANIDVKNMAYEVALSIRESQVFGLSSQRGSGKYDSPYGTHFNINSNTFETFIDNNSNGRYYSSENIETLTINKNIYVSGIKVDCSTKNEVTITYLRPDPDATIKSGSNANYGFTEISLQPLNNSDYTKYVIVRDTGQIYVSDEPECT